MQPNLANLLSQQSFDSIREKVQILWSKNDLPTFRYDNVLVHSRFDPWQEAAKRVSAQDLVCIAKANRILLVPADFLYTVEFLLQRKIFTLHAKLFLIFPCLEVIFALFVCRDLSFLQGVQAYFFLDVEQISPQQLHVEESKKFFVLSNFALQKSHPDFYKEQRHKFFERFSQWFSDCMTQFYFEKIWIKNTIQNVFLRKPLYSLKALQNRHQKQTALIIGPGPSLQQDIHLVQEYGKYAILIACDTALPALLTNNVTPDYVVSLDAGYFNSLDFRKLPGKQVSLIAAVICSPLILRKFLGKIFLFSCGDQLDPQDSEDGISQLLQQLQISLPKLPTGGSVGHTALAFADFVGCDTVVLLGFDMSYPFLETHVFDGIHFDGHYRQSDRLQPVSTGFAKSLHLEFLEDFVFVETNDGAKSFSSAAIQKYYQRLPFFLKKFQRIINASLYGRKLPLTKYQSIEELLRGVSHNSAVVVRPLKEVVRVFSIPLTERGFIKTLGDIQQRLKSLCQTVEECENFSQETVQLSLEEILQEMPFLKKAVSQVSFFILRKDASVDAKNSLLLLCAEMWKYTASIGYKLFDRRGVTR